MGNLTKLIRRQRAVQLAFTMGVALLFTTALLWGLGRVTLAQANPTATVRYVDGSSGSDSGDCSNSASPCATIKNAINQSTPGDEIRVAKSTYTETFGIHITLTLRGGYEAAGWTRDIAANPTIIDANGANAGVIDIPPGVSVTVEGFTIQGANHTSDNGGGFIINGATVVISATLIQNNSATDSGGDTFGGGGLWFEGNGVNVSLINSSLLTNTAGDFGGGGINGCCTNGTGILSLDNVEVRGNNTSGSGGGLSMSDATVTVTNSQIISNSTSGGGGGLSIDSSSVTLTSVIVRGNKAIGSGFTNGGGIAVRNSNLTLNDSVIENNEVRSTGGGENLGGAIDNNFGSVEIINTIIRNNNSQGTPVVQLYQAVFTVTNSLVVENQGPGVSGGTTQGTFTNVTIANNSGIGLEIGGPEPGDPDVNAVIVNSILWGNGGSDYSCSVTAGMGGCTLSYSDVGVGDTTGTGNISTDPLFVDAANGDYHLSPGSPAIDAGTANGAPADDLDGKPRDAAPDMGTYEWRGFRILLPLTHKNLGP